MREGSSNPDPRIQYTSTVDNSLKWRLFHGLNYMNGGITFLIGSYMYYPQELTEDYGDIVGAWLFTLGSLTFLIADLTEWNHFKYGCCGFREYDGAQTCWRSFKRLEVGLNFFASVLGSLLYLLGSIFFIPDTNLLTTGELLFIIGSLVIFFSQMWKCLRTAFTHEETLGLKWNKQAVVEDIEGFLVDFFAGLGGLFYFFGTYYFQFVVTDQDETYATNLFLCGGISFTLSGLSMQYRYFCARKEDTLLEHHGKENVEFSNIK